MEIKDGMSIEFLEDVTSPVQMAGAKGSIKIVGKDIELYYAKRLTRGTNVLAKVVVSQKPEPETKTTGKGK